MQCYSVTKGGIDIFIIIETFPSPAGVMLERAKVISEERVQSMINYQQQATVKIWSLEHCFCLRTERRNIDMNEQC